MNRNPQSYLFLLAALLSARAATFGEDTSSSAGYSNASTDNTPALSKLLPPSIAESLDVNVWGWLSYAHSNSEYQSSYWDADLSLGATKRFGDRMAVSTDMHFLDANDNQRGWLEQAYLTVKLSERSETLFTIGKFNALFGVEPRNAWDRLGGTTSLLFGAEPQDLLGVMITQPIGATGITLKPFVTTGFQGRSDFNEPPSAGLLVQYHPTHEWAFSITNWVGPGFVSEYDESDSGTGYVYTYARHARHADAEYDAASYRSYYSNYALANWTGPNLEADRGGTLYFLDGTATWLPRPDLTLAAEGLLAASGPSAGQLAWWGFLVLGNYDLTDRWRLFARWSFLNDINGIVSGLVQRRHELSGGVGFQVIRGTELRGEYRHDFSNADGNLDTVSVHLNFAY